MPHVSQKRLDPNTVAEIETQLKQFLGSTSVKTREEITNELLSETERIMLAKRLAVIHMLDRDETVYTIHQKIGVSPSTVARYARAMQQKRFQHTRRWLARNSNANAILQTIADLVAFPADAHKRSLRNIVEEDL